MNEFFHAEPGSPVKRLRLLMISRVAIVSFLLVLALLSEIKETGVWPGESIPFFYTIIILVYILSIAYIGLLKLHDNLRMNIYIQNICDVMVITGLVYVTGGARSIYTVFYPLVIIYSILFLGRNGGLVIASACSLLYGLTLGLEFYGVVSPMGMFAGDYPLPAGYVYTRILTHVLSFFVIAFLASFVVEQEKKTRLLLEEKENAFKQLDQLHQSIIESVDAGIITVSLQGNIKSFNRAARDITGYTFAEVKDRNIGDAFPGFKTALERDGGTAVRSSSRRRVEITVCGKNNKHVFLGCSVSSLKDNRGIHIGEIIIFQDMTAIREMEDNLEKSRRLAVIGEMAAGLAHEIRNPLASISGSIQVLRKGLDLNETDEKLMQIILRGKDQLESVVKDFLFLARPHSGVYEETDMKEVISDVIESLRYGPDWNEGVQVEPEFMTSATRIEMNQAEIRQVIWNLLLNAVQSMPDGGKLTVAVDRVSVPGGGGDEYMEIRIADNGAGIAEEDLGKVFEPFHTTKEKGTGLGLAVVNRIIEGHSGKVTIESRVNQGTTCFVLLPVHHREESR
jgi:two-component system, NtrC family, sensor histidine kinase PilS